MTEGSSNRGKGAFFTLYGSSYPAGSMIAQAWGISRIIDVLEQNAASLIIDPKKTAVTGCSRYGKVALVVGAFDERIALTIPQESGSGGTSSWRMADWEFQGDSSVLTLPMIASEDWYFATSFDQFKGSTTKLPFDNHMLMAMVAPRALLLIDNAGLVPLAPQSAWGASLTARKVYQALGVTDRMGISQAPTHSHCSFPSSQQPELTAFITRFLLDGSANTDVTVNGGSYTFAESDWVGWTVPPLN